MLLLLMNSEKILVGYILINMLNFYFYGYLKYVVIKTGNLPLKCCDNDLFLNKLFFF